MKRDLRVYDNIVDAIGQTPLVRLQRIPAQHGVECQMFAKCEFVNPGGSIKDRIGRFMVEGAEKDGRLKPGGTIVESTSGNTGIGLALVAAVKGYNIIITIPDKMSLEKINTLKALGAKVIVAPTERATDHPESYVYIARELGKLPGHVHMNQYSNDANVNTHYMTTSFELLDQMEEKIDYIFVGVGTGGTITGLSKRIHERFPNTKFIGIDPVGSVLARPESMNEGGRKPYKIEGIGPPLVPNILDYSHIHEWVKVSDTESYDTARALIHEEGFLCGGTCGSCVIGAIKYLKSKNLHQDKNLRCVVILPDSIKNYMTKHLVDEWMFGNGFWPLERMHKPEKDFFGGKTILEFGDLIKPLPVLDKSLKVIDCLDLLKKGIHTIPIVQNGEIAGVVTSTSLAKTLTALNLEKSNNAVNAITKDYLKVPLETPIHLIQKCLDAGYPVLIAGNVKEDQRIYSLNHQQIISLIELSIK